MYFVTPVLGNFQQSSKLAAEINSQVTNSMAPARMKINLSTSTVVISAASQNILFKRPSRFAGHDFYMRPAVG